MKARLPNIARKYAATLRKFARSEQEADLEQAYALGRSAVASGFGVLDMARIHQSSLEHLLSVEPEARRQKIWRAAETFMLESLSPFEATHRGFFETFRRLKVLVATQNKRNKDLADVNCKLIAEICRRRLTEKALRESEQHYRKLFSEARRMEENLRNLSNQILDVQEDERKRISRELHDETGQALTAISVTLAGLRRNGHPPASKERMIRDAQRMLKSTMETLHDFARELRPTMLDELGLLPALRSYLKAFADRNRLQVCFNADPTTEELNDAGKTVLFRVAQESLTNVAKHAKASRVDFDICKTGDRISMTIKDNGKSFQENAENSAKRKQRLGLLGMQERVRLVSGQFEIRPQFGKGTTVQVSIPIKPVRPPSRLQKLLRLPAEEPTDPNSTLNPKEL